MSLLRYYTNYSRCIFCMYGYGFWFGVLCASVRLVRVRPLHVFCLQCVWSTMCVHMDWFTFFGNIIGSATGQVRKLLMCS